MFAKTFMKYLLQAQLARYFILQDFSREEAICSGPEVIKLFSCSTQLSTKFILLINVKMPTIVVILTCISMINTTSD